MITLAGRREIENTRTTNTSSILKKKNLLPIQQTQNIQHLIEFAHEHPTLYRICTRTSNTGQNLHTNIQHLTENAHEHPTPDRICTRTST